MSKIVRVRKDVVDRATSDLKNCVNYLKEVYVNSQLTREEWQQVEIEFSVWLSKMYNSMVEE